MLSAINKILNIPSMLKDLKEQENEGLKRRKAIHDSRIEKIDKAGDKKPRGKNGEVDDPEGLVMIDVEG